MLFLQYYFEVPLFPSTAVHLDAVVPLSTVHLSAVVPLSTVPLAAVVPSATEGGSEAILGKRMFRWWSFFV